MSKSNWCYNCHLEKWGGTTISKLYIQSWWCSLSKFKYEEHDSSLWWWTDWLLSKTLSQSHTFRLATKIKQPELQPRWNFIHLMSLCRKHNIILVLCSHFHHYQRPIHAFVRPPSKAKVAKCRMCSLLNIIIVNITSLVITMLIVIITSSSPSTSSASSWQKLANAGFAHHNALESKSRLLLPQFPETWWSNSLIQWSNSLI